MEIAIDFFLTMAFILFVFYFFYNLIDRYLYKERVSHEEMYFLLNSLREMFSKNIFEISSDGQKLRVTYKYTNSKIRSENKNKVDALSGYYLRVEDEFGIGRGKKGRFFISGNSHQRANRSLRINKKLIESIRVVSDKNLFEGERNRD